MLKITLASLTRSSDFSKLDLSVDKKLSENVRHMPWVKKKRNFPITLGKNNYSYESDSRFSDYFNYMAHKMYSFFACSQRIIIKKSDGRYLEYRLLSRLKAVF